MIDLSKLPPIKVKLPTQEQLFAMGEKWFKSMNGTLLDQWYNTFKHCTAETVFVEIPRDKLQPIVNGKLQFSRKCDFFTTLYDALQKIKLNPMMSNEIFVRLNSRSPKDLGNCIFSFKQYDCLETMANDIVIALGSSLRTAEDMIDFYNYGHTPCYICIREHRTFSIELEFRVFVKDDEIIGISHYDYTNPNACEDLHLHQYAEESIKEFFDTHIKDKIVLYDYVFDVHHDVTALNTTELIEFNPYGLSDPCHFGSYQNIESYQTPNKILYQPFQE